MIAQFTITYKMFSEDIYDVQFDFTNKTSLTYSGRSYLFSFAAAAL